MLRIAGSLDTHLMSWFLILLPSVITSDTAFTRISLKRSLPGFFLKRTGAAIYPQKSSLLMERISRRTQISMTKAIPATTRTYEEQLMKEINKDRKAHEKKPFDGGSGGGSPKEKAVTVSRQIQKAACSIKGSTNATSHMKPIRHATGITSCWILLSPAGMFMIA